MPLSKEFRTRVDLGRTNRRAVLAEVVLRGPLSRTDIASRTGLTASTVSRITRDLIDADLVMERPENATPTGQLAPGRRFINLDINSGGGFVLGFGVNVFRQSVTLADLKNRRIARQDLDLQTLSDPDLVLRQLIDAARRMIENHVPDHRLLLGGVCAITGAVDPNAGVVHTSPYMGWGEVHLGHQLSDALDIPIRIESMPHAIALAESRFGVTLNHENSLLFNCSLGLSASFLAGRQVIRGSAFTAGAIGGLRPLEPASGGPTLDMVASGHGVLRRLYDNDRELANLPGNEMAQRLLRAIDLAKGKDLDVCRAMASSGRVLGRAIAHYVGLLRPDAVVIAGALAEAESYVDACRTEILQETGAGNFKVFTSSMSGQAAARWLAIGEYLFERDLDLDGLKIVKAA